MGAILPKGILIYGVPGTGKTMLANAFIEECGIASIVLRKTKTSSETLEDIYNAFKKAKALKECIILIDDIDKFSESSSEDCDDEAFVAIQSGIDSVKDENVLVIATANEYRKLPNSLRRSGRFDRKIRLNAPSKEDSRKIMEFYMKDKSVDKNLNYDDLACMFNYNSCAELQTILNESAIYAASQKKECMDINDIVRAYLRDSYQSPDKTVRSSSWQIETTALHEAGHATVAEAIKEGSVGFISLSVSGRDFTGGFTHISENFTRRSENVLIALGGKAAVELFYEGKCASGCQSDLSKAAFYIRQGVENNATHGLGFYDLFDEELSQKPQSHLEKTEAIVQAQLERYMFQVRDILFKNKDFLMKLSEELKKKEYLLHSDIKRIRETTKLQSVGQIW